MDCQLISHSQGTHITVRPVSYTEGSLFSSTILQLSQACGFAVYA